MTSQRIPGLSQEDMRAIWKDFVRKSFGPTRFTTSFNGKSRPVFRDGVKNLIVLDEYHGALELLAFQSKPGPVRHVGSQQITVEYAQPDATKGIPAKVTKVGLGFASMVGQHKFTLVGQL